MKKIINKIVTSHYWWLMLLLILFGINYLAAYFHARFDLTKEKRYTLSPVTKNLLDSLDDKLTIEVFLKGSFPAGFQKLANSTDEFLNLLKDRNSEQVFYRFISPQDIQPGTNQSYEDTLVKMGATAINLSVQVKEGEENKRVYPIAVLKYKNRQALVPLYTGTQRMITPVEMNSAEALMEYQFVKTIDGLVNPIKPLVAYSKGNGEPVDYSTYDLQQTLQKHYQLYLLDLKNQPNIPDTFKVLMIVKPTLQFSESEKFKIDQYLMRGGKLLCFIDNLIAEQDSLRFKPETIAYDRNLNLTDQFFRYGVRINTDLVMDLQCDYMPFAVGGSSDKPQFEFLKWNYYPLFESNGNHTINKNIGLVAGKFVNSMDTINSPGVQKTPLLYSSDNSRTISTPALISINENKNVPVDAAFNKKHIPVAYLLEGNFQSLFKNRVSKAQLDTLQAEGTPFLASSQSTKMIIAADGDIVLNEMSPKEGPLPMGMNFYTLGTQYEYQFANRDFLQNCLEYLVNKPGIIETRNKDIVLRLLNPEKVKEEKSMWQFINIALPVLLVLFLGWMYQQIRKRKYAG